MRVTVLFFGGLKEALACGSEVLALPVEASPSVTYLYQELCRRHVRLPSLMASVRLALNEEFLPGIGEAALTGSAALRDGDVIAFIPPVTGG
jgi:molybdopterin converting factor small subunit